MRQRKHEYFMSQDERLAILETTVGHIHETLERLDKRFDTMDRRFDKMDERIHNEITVLRQETRQEIKSIHTQIWGLFAWVVASFAGTFGVFAKVMHWF